MVLKFLDRIVMSAQLFFRWDQAMNFFVAIAAQIGRFTLLLPSKILFEPAVFMTGPWDQVVFGRTFSQDSPAQFTAFRFVFLFHLFCTPTSGDFSFGNQAV